MKVLTSSRRKGRCFGFPIWNYVKQQGEQETETQHTPLPILREAYCLSPQTLEMLQNWKQWCRAGAENTGVVCKTVQLVIRPPSPLLQGSQAIALTQSLQGNVFPFWKYREVSIWRLLGIGEGGEEFILSNGTIFLLFPLFSTRKKMERKQREFQKWWQREVSRQQWTSKQRIQPIQIGRKSDVFIVDVYKGKSRTKLS